MPTFRARHEAVRELRERKRLTQEEAWQRAGIAQGTYQAMESKKAFEEGREFKEANLEAVAMLFEVSIPDIAHDIPEAKAAQWLVTELEDLKAACRSDDQRLHTPHLLVSLLRLERSLLALAVQRAATIPVTTLISKLERGLSKIAPELAGFRDFEWSENRYYRRALQYAALQKRDAHDGDLALAILQLGLAHPASNTVTWFQAKLGSEAFGKVMQQLRDLEPLDPATPSFPDSTLG